MLLSLTRPAVRRLFLADARLLLSRGALAMLTTGVAAVSAAEKGERLSLASDGETRYLIRVAEDSPASQAFAAEALKRHLERATGATFPIRALGEGDAARPALAVGPAAARSAAEEIDLGGLGPDGVLLRTVGRSILLTGEPSAPRGTLYAVHSFLERAVGYRWWAPGATRTPEEPNLSVPRMDRRHVPPLAYREVYSQSAFDPDWAVRNKLNGHRPPIPEKKGGHLTYTGFVHTFYDLVPPEKHFADHPEWYAWIEGERRHRYDGGPAQLCLTDDALVEHVARRVRRRLQESPHADIVSVSQNDRPGSSRCRCDACRAVEKEEGSPSGPLIRFVNAVAKRVEPRFPDVAISTLAYRYTRQPPAHVRPRDNVIVRLASIECSFSQPMTHPANAAFRKDIEGWSAICDRLYVWNYVTNFSRYFQPHPNLRVLGPNVEFFVGHSVRGLFEQGAYNVPHAELAPLRSWVLAKLLWDPTRDAEALIEEFLHGYYGPAAPFLERYIAVTHDAVESTGYELHCFTPPDAAFLTPEVLLRAERLFREARRAVRDRPTLLQRVRIAHLPVRYVLLVRWPDLRAAAKEDPELTWPYGRSRAELLAAFKKVCETHGIDRLSEHGRPVSSLEKRLGDP